MTAPSDRLEPLPTSELENRKQLFRPSLFREDALAELPNAPRFPPRGALRRPSTTQHREGFAG
jgi:hypothetical protein